MTTINSSIKNSLLYYYKIKCALGCFKSLFGFAIIFFAVGCDPHDGKLTIVNNTDDTIFYSFSYESDSIMNYPINQKSGDKNYGYSYIILPKGENHEPIMDTWEYFINERCKDSTLRVFFFSMDLIKSAGKDSIMKNQLYSKKEKLKVKDLEKLNWRVVYHQKE